MLILVAMAALLLVGWVGYQIVFKQKQARIEQEEWAKQTQSKEKIKAEERADALALQGYDAVKDGNFREAITLLSQAMQYKKDDAFLMWTRGKAYAKLGEYDRAITDYSEAIERDRDNADWYTDRADAYYEQKKYSQAADDYSKAIELKPKERNLYLLLKRGRAYYMAGDDYKAIGEFTGVIEVDDKNGDAFYERANAYSGLKKYDQAISDYSKAIRLKPGYWPLLLFRAEVYSKKGDHEQAIDDLSEVIDLSSKHAKAYCLRGVEKQKVKDVTANSDIARAIELGLKCPP